MMLINSTVSNLWKKVKLTEKNYILVYSYSVCDSA